MAAVQTQRQTSVDTGRIVAAAVAIALVVGSVLGAIAVNAIAGLKPGPDSYSIAAWEVRNFPNKWLFLVGQIFRGTSSLAEQDVTLRRFLEINGRIDELGNESSDMLSRGLVIDRSVTEELDDLLEERESIENQVEATLESRLAQVIKEEGLTRDLLFDVVWPPVDAEFTEAPRALARSPRDRIELLGSSLMREGLTLAEVEAIESDAQGENTSALSFATSGIGAYPTIIDNPDDYRRAVEVIAHEWMHNYLFFRPLGFNYYDNNDLRTMNETVADLVGRELAERVIEQWPLADPPEAEPALPAVPSQPGLDLRAELRKLRGEVDEILAAGKVEEAEALMERRRQELADAGYFIRKINQAYFAYLNLYAGEAGSVAATNPIGPKIDQLRERSQTLQQFVDLVGNVTSVRELDAALASLQ